MLRLLIKDITVEKNTEPKQALLHVRWKGGACETLLVDLPLKIQDRLRYPEVLVDRIRSLARSYSDDETAATLNKEGRCSAKGSGFNVSMIRWIRYRHRILAPTFERPEEQSVKQIADKLGVKPSVVYYWIERGVLPARRKNRGSPYWVVLQSEKEQELAGLLWPL